MSALGKHESRNALKLLGWAAALGLVAIAAALRPVIGMGATHLLMALGAAVALAACVAWFVGLDEFAQRAHYVAWFWGGSAGLAAIAFVSFAASALGWVESNQIGAIVARLGGEADVGGAFLAGMVFVIAPMTLGYTIWWAAYWLRRL